MATIVTSSSPTTPVSGSPSTSSTSASRTYLNRCVEDLSPNKVSACQGKASQWNIIAVVSTVAFFALAIGAFVAAGILYPMYLPIAGISAILLSIPAVQQIQQFQAWSRAAQDEGDKYSAIQRTNADLARQTPANLQHLLIQNGIAWYLIPGMDISHPERLKRLTPLLAQSKYLEDKTQHWMTKKTEQVNAARSAPTPDEKAICRHLALQYEENAMDHKIQNAFVNAVLRNPDFNGTLENLGTLSKNRYPDRALGNALGDASVNQVFSFNNRTLAPLTYNDIKTMSVSDLGQRFFAAMAA